MLYPTWCHGRSILCQGVQGEARSLGGPFGALPAPEAQLLAPTQARVGPSFGVLVEPGRDWGGGRDVLLAPACAPLPLSPCPVVEGHAGQDKGPGGSCWAPAAQGRPRPPGAPARPPPRPRGGGRASAFVCTAAAGQVRRKRAPSCGRSWARRPPAPPSLGQIQKLGRWHRRGDCFPCHGACH